MKRSIQVSGAVWAEIAKRGNFGETEDDVLRRVFGLAPESPARDRKSKGAEAAAWGRKTADAVARTLGARSINPNANEYVLDGEKVTIRCARATTNSVGVTFNMLDRIDAVLAALEADDAAFDIYRLEPAAYRDAMRLTRSKGPSSGRVGIVMTKVFRDEGKFVGNLKIQSTRR